MNRLPFAFFSLLVLGTACPKDTVSRLRGHFVAPEMIDFGDVQVGTTVTRVIDVVNDAAARFDNVTISNGAGFDRFGVTPTRFELPTGVTVKLTVSFSPSAVSADPIESAFTILTDYTNDDADSPVSARVLVRGRGIMEGLTVTPNPVDFGTVLVGAYRDVTVTITNNETNPVLLTSAIGGDSKPTIEHTAGTGRFEVVTMLGADGSVAGETGKAIASHETVMVTLRYVPDIATTGPSQDRGRWTLSCSDGHCGIPLVLTGHGTTAAIECSPPIVEFGKVNPGVTLTKHTSCKNVADQPVRVTSWALDQGTALEFALGDNPPNAVELQHDESVELNVRFTPTLDTLRAGQEKSGSLSVQSRAENPPRMLQGVSVRLTGSAGGPTINVAPPMLSFGQVALGTTLTRRLLVENTGYDTLTVQGLQFVDPIYGSMELTPFSVAPGDSKLVPIDFTPIAEGAVVSTLLITSDDVGKPEVTVALFGEGIALPPCEYAIAPSSVSFGSVVLPQSANQTVRVENHGTADCLVRDVALDGASDFHLRVGQEIDFRIPPGESKDIGVFFTPLQPGVQTGNLGFYISDPLASTPSVNLTGAGLSSGLLVSPDQIEFGEVAVGCSTGQRTITIYNLGTAATTIDSISVVDTATTVAFILSDLPTLPFDIPAGHTVEFSVAFRPDTAASHRNGYVHVVENGTPDPYIVALYGTTSPEPKNEERYQQAQSAAIDILFVVDNSCSMSAFQAALASNFASFIQEAVVQAYDYQMGVITCDVDDDVSGFDCGTLPAQRPAGMDQGKCGYLADGDPTQTRVDPTWRIITPNTLPSVEEAFTTIAVQGAGGTGIERGLESAYQALTAPKINGWNAGFLRPEASLAIIMVSDDDNDDEQAELFRQRPAYADFYLNFFRSIKGFADPTRFSFSAIVNPPRADLGLPMCFTEDPGVVYTQYTQATGGVLASICPGVDWSVSLAMLGQSVFGYRSQFNLLNVPDTSTIEVKVNDMVVPPEETSGLINWNYDPTSNSVRFTPATIPEPGANIVISYEPLCQ